MVRRDKTRESVSDPLAGISTDLVAVRNGAQDLARRTDQVREEFVLALRELHADVLRRPHRQAENLEQEESGDQQEPATDAADADGEVGEAEGIKEVETDNENDDADMAADETETAEAEEFHGLLKKAAGISHATVIANRDTWAFLVEHTAGDRHRVRRPGRRNGELNPPRGASSPRTQRSRRSRAWLASSEAIRRSRADERGRPPIVAHRTDPSGGERTRRSVPAARRRAAPQREVVVNCTSAQGMGERSNDSMRSAGAAFGQGCVIASMRHTNSYHSPTTHKTHPPRTRRRGIH